MQSQIQIHDIPATVGKVVPGNAFELMKHLRESEKEYNAKAKAQKSYNRQLKQDLQRESIEKKLMEGEDYTFTSEGTRRLKAYEDRIQMETEDVLSMNNEKAYRNLLALDFRAKIRREIEERQKQEEIERQKKREEAEKRRQQIVERMRQKKEEEERAIREAEQALKRAEMERLLGIELQLRKEQEELAKFERNRNDMVIEDELSKLAEEIHREEDARKKWLKQEAERMAKWEQEQLMRDAIEEQQRQFKLAELELKKKKLAELREKSNMNTTDAESQKKGLEHAKEESIKLNKQMRIQNKAKFVSKKIKKSTNNENNVTDEHSVVVVHNDNDLGLKTESELARSNNNIASLGNISVITIDNNSNNNMISKLTTEYINEINNVNDIEILRSNLSHLMDSKREMRMKLMKLKQNDNNIIVEEEKREIEKLQENYQHVLDEIMAKELLINSKIDNILEHKESQQHEESVAEERDCVDSPMSMASVLGHKSQGKVLSPYYSRTNVISLESVNHASSAHKLGRKLSSRARDIIPNNEGNADTSRDVFLEAEQCIRDINRIVSATGVSGLKKIASIHSNSSNSHNDLNTIIRKAEMLKLHASDILCKLPPPELDVIGYKDKLISYQEKITQFLEIQQQPAMTTSPLVTNSHKEVVDEIPSMITSNVTVESVNYKRNLMSQFEDAVDESTPVSCLSPVQTTAVIRTTSSTGQIISNDATLSTTLVSQSEKLATQISIANKMSLDNETNGVACKSNISHDVVDMMDEENEMDGCGDATTDEVPPPISYEDIVGWNECLNTSMATAAHHAAFYGYTEVIETLSYYFDVFVMDKNGRTPLFYASLRNNIDCILFLVGLDSQWIEVGDIRGDTCIHAAAISNQTTGLEFLVTCEANPNIANNEGLTPAHLATNSKSLDVMHEAGACLYCIDLHSRMPLWYACKEGRTSCVQSLCKATPIEYISFPDDEGNTPLHMACLGGHSDIVEILCQYIHNYNDYYIVNKKGYTPIHLAANSEVLKKLYEYGVELWVFDAKFRYPLFVSCFHGRVDCVTFLMEIGMQQDMSLITKKDKQGDTALHVASLCGHIKCVSLLLFVCNSEPNSQGFTPEILAERAGHTQLSSFIKSVMEHKNNGYSTLDIFQCTFNNLSSVLLYYGSRWTKLYDIHSQVVYYFDRVLGASQWHRPDSYDELPINEMNTDKARDILINFYTLYNPEKLYQINEILHVYDNKFPELFIQLANRYEVQDLSIFKM